jgi:hypothetical protein
LGIVVHNSIDHPEMYKKISHFFEEMLSYRERKLRLKATDSMRAIFKKLSKSSQTTKRNIIFSLSSLMLDGKRLKKYAVACLLPDAALNLHDDGFQKVSPS